MLCRPGPSCISRRLGCSPAQVTFGRCGKRDGIKFVNVAGLVEFGRDPDPCSPFGKHHPRLGATGTVRKFGMVRITALPSAIANGEKGTDHRRHRRSRSRGRDRPHTSGPGACPVCPSRSRSRGQTFLPDRVDPRAPKSSSRAGGPYRLRLTPGGTKRAPSNFHRRVHVVILLV